MGPAFDLQEVRNARDAALSRPIPPHGVDNRALSDEESEVIHRESVDNGILVLFEATPKGRINPFIKWPATSVLFSTRVPSLCKSVSRSSGLTKPWGSDETVRATAARVGSDVTS